MASKNIFSSSFPSNHNLQLRGFSWKYMQNCRAIFIQHYFYNFSITYSVLVVAGTSHQHPASPFPLCCYICSGLLCLVCLSSFVQFIQFTLFCLDLLCILVLFVLGKTSKHRHNFLHGSPPIVHDVQLFISLS